MARINPSPGGAPLPGETPRPAAVAQKGPATLPERLAAARAARDAAVSRMTPADREEAAQRAELAALDEERIAAEKAARELDLARRLDKAAGELGPTIPVRSLDLESGAAGCGTFVVRAPSARAVTAWTRALADAAQNPKIDREAIGRDFAAAAVYDWNGSTDLHGVASEDGAALLELLKARPFVSTSIANVASELGGLVLEARKS